MEWISKYNNDNLSSSNRIISTLIYELTGQVRRLKVVSSHFQILKWYSNRRETETAQHVDMKQSSALVTPKPAVAIEKSVVSTESSEILSYLSTIVSDPDGLWIQCNETSSAKDLLSLSSVNRLYRTECLHPLTSNLHFDFGSDGRALQRFCSTAPAEALAGIYHLQVTLVEGYMTGFPDLPNLRTLDIDLWPRNPVHWSGPGVEFSDRAWGTQTETVLAALGVTVAVRARIRLEMRWAADCERFEREYVEKGRWRRISEGDEYGAPGQEGSFCRRYYELCGNGKCH